MHIRGLMALILAGTLTSAGESVKLPPAAGMFDLYRQNRLFKVPNQITEDFLLLSYSMIAEEAVSKIETEKDVPGFSGMVKRLHTVAKSAGTGAAEKANAQFLAVLDDLLAENPAQASDAAVARELELIRGAAGPARSDILSQTIDYSQFRPRGHYTATPALSRYFQAIRYAGAALFYVQASQATGIDAATADRLTQQAMLLSQWMDRDPQSKKWYGEFEARRSWMFGPAEDLRFEDVIKVAATLPKSPIPTVRSGLLRFAHQNGRQPAVLSGVFDPSRLETGVTAADAFTGFRLVPGSFTPAAAAAQELVYPKVGKYLGTATPQSITSVNGTLVKGFPLANEIMSLLGSGQAAESLKKSDDTNYQDYPAAATKAKQLLARPAGLPGRQLDLLKSWFAEGEPTNPSRLDTARGFWTWMLHGSVLYAKQSYTGVGKGLSPRDDRTSAWLEPAAGLYTGLRDISAEWARRTADARFTAFTKVLDRCLEIAKKEKAGTALPAEDVEYLNGLDLELLALTGGEDHPIAADFHTDLNSGKVLTEALAYPRSDESHPEARGARFQPEEFKQDVSNRLTDEAWQASLKNGGAKQ